MDIKDLPTAKDFDDWEYLLPGYESSEYSGTYSIVDGSQVDDVTPERIAHVDAFHAVSPEGCHSTDMCSLVELTDGTWASVMAWCDATGWDCRSDVQWKWGPDRDSVIRLGLDRSARKELGLMLHEDAVTTDGRSDV